MREARKSLYEQIVGRRRFVSEGDDRFLAGCEIPIGTEDARIALAVRRVVAQYASVEPNEVLCDYRIESDLGISFVDSLNLVDAALDIEKEAGLTVSDEMAAEIGRLNKKDSIVREIIQYLTKHHSQA